MARAVTLQPRSQGDSPAVASRDLRVEIPLPTVDNAGLPFDDGDLHWFEAELTAIASGFRKYLDVNGGWYDDRDAITYREPVQVYVATIRAVQLRPLTELLALARLRFRQRAILCEVNPVQRILLDEDWQPTEAEHV